jgi:hypothetical protein
MSSGKPYKFRDPRPLGGAAAVFLYLYLIAFILHGVAVILKLPGQSGANGSEGLSADLIDLLDEVTQLVYLLALALAAFVFLKWTYRVVANARLFDPAMPFRPGWAVGWHFIPLGSLFKPFEYFAEAWRVSQKPAPSVMAGAPRILRWWWGLWLVTNLCNNYSFSIGKNVDDARAITVSVGLLLLAIALSLPLTLILVRIIQTLGTWQWDRRPQDEVTRVEI